MVKSQQGDQALLKNFVPLWAQAELMWNACCQSIGGKRSQLYFKSLEDEILEEEAAKLAPSCAITATAGLSILATTWQSNVKCSCGNS